MSKDSQNKNKKENESSPSVDVVICILCGAEMYELHCKYICPNCAYREDCSDH